MQYNLKNELTVTDYCLFLHPIIFFESYFNINKIKQL